MSCFGPKAAVVNVMVKRRDCVKKTRKRHAVRKMKEGPSKPSCRGGLQTAISCFGQKPWWLTLWSKGVPLEHVRYG